MGTENNIFLLMTPLCISKLDTHFVTSISDLKLRTFLCKSQKMIATMGLVPRDLSYDLFSNPLNAQSLSEGQDDSNHYTL